MDPFEKCYQWEDAKIARAEGYYPYFTPIQETSGNEVVIDGKKMVMCGSNNYLGLTFHPKVMESSLAATRKYGTSCSGSRFLNGTLDLHVELESKLAEFVGKESAIVFSTGFQSNLGAIPPLVGRDEVIVIDQYNHASIIDGARLSFGKMVKFLHNDAEDLERVLAKVGDKGKLIIVDGVFSMEGNTCNLPGVVEAAEKYSARVMVDDAHALGVLGPKGDGTAASFGLTDKVDLIMGTFSKSLASLGGFIAGELDVLDYIKHNSRALIFSAAMPPGSIAAVSAALDVIVEEPERRERLWEITGRMQTELRGLGFDLGNSDTPIIPVIIGDDLKTFAVWRALFDAGVFVNPVRTPAVPPGRALLRTSYMSTHTDEQIDFVLSNFAKVGKQFGII
ncbi:aminotransferase class I/II-fold pyridoxal phosphate-dependent enzyme [candidate division KSB1 bacterium]